MAAGATTMRVANVGPIEELAIQAPTDEGGIIVLHGRNGSGKTHALDAAGRLLGGNQRPPVADGARKGTIEGWGARINISSRITSKGTLVADSLEGKLDLATLVDPGIESPDAADAKRIRALLSLVGSKGDAKQFESLGLDEELLASIDPNDDLVGAAGKVKRAAENEARKLERMAAKLLGEAEGLRSGCEGIYSAEPEIDMAALHEELEKRIASKAAMQKQVELAQQQKFSREKAQQAISDIGRVAVTEAENRLKLSKLKEQELKEAADSAQYAYEQQQNEVEYLTDQLEREREKAAKLEVAKQTLESESGCMPSITEQEAAESAVLEAREAIERGATFNEVRQKINQAQEKEGQAAQTAREANRLREAAKATDDVLSDAVEGLGVALQVKAGRLVTRTEDRGIEHYSELSHGERWKLAIDLGVKRVGEAGVLVIPQEAWEGLDPTNRRALGMHARRRKVLLLTAEARNGDLGWERYA